MKRHNSYVSGLHEEREFKNEKLKILKTLKFDSTEGVAKKMISRLEQEISEIDSKIAELTKVKRNRR